MQIRTIRFRRLMPPKDSLTEALLATRLKLKEGDIVAISSKVVSIDEGNCVPVEGTDKDALIRKESEWYFEPKNSKYRRRFTITKGYIPGGAGIDESNANGHYVLYPKDPFKSARRLRAWLKKTYTIKKLGVIITDSSSIPLRRGAIGFALSWDGLDPLHDYRGTQDIFGREIKIEVANLIDPLAAAAVFEMGEGKEQTPVAVISNAKNILFKNRSSKGEQLIVSPEDDLFAPLIWQKGWKQGG